jgi:hypothetical protein
MPPPVAVHRAIIDAVEIAIDLAGGASTRSAHRGASRLYQPSALATMLCRRAEPRPLQLGDGSGRSVVLSRREMVITKLFLWRKRMRVAG